MGRTAVMAGTATAVAGKVAAGQEATARRGHQAAADRAQLQEMQQRARVDAQVAEALGRAPAPAPVPAPTSVAASVDELYAQLTKLGELRQAGLLSDDEFAQQKARLLA
jgi:hypothetical protein